MPVTANQDARPRELEGPAPALKQGRKTLFIATLMLPHKPPRRHSATPNVTRLGSQCGPSGWALSCGSSGLGGTHGDTPWPLAPLRVTVLVVAWGTVARNRHMIPAPCAGLLGAAPCLTGFPSAGEWGGRQRAGDSAPGWVPKQWLRVGSRRRPSWDGVATVMGQGAKRERAREGSCRGQRAVSARSRR